MTDLELALKLSRDKNAPRALRDKANEALETALQREIDRRPDFLAAEARKRGFLGAVLK